MRRTMLTFLSAASLAAVDWVAPADAAAVANPVASTPAVLAGAKQTYSQFCIVCHGASGKGDGDAAGALDPKPASFSAPAVAAQSDGALFWKIGTGRNGMPGWKAALSDQQRWEMVCYLRSLAPAQPAK